MSSHEISARSMDQAWLRWDLRELFDEGLDDAYNRWSLEQTGGNLQEVLVKALKL